jgi:hypothetical protein
MRKNAMSEMVDTVASTGDTTVFWEETLAAATVEQEYGERQ